MTDTEFISMREDLKNILHHRLRFKFYLGSVSSSDWDDAQVLTQSGVDVWTSGLVLPIKNLEGSNEAVLIEQGKIKTSDKRLYLRGDTITTAPDPGAIKFGVGSPIEGEYSIIPNGEEKWPSVGEAVYKKVYVREIVGGSFINEA